MDAPDDPELLRRYADQQSEEAFVELVRRHLHLVYRAALRRTRGDAHRAEDVVQAVFVELARKAGSLSRHPRLLGWLYTTTHYVASAQLRREARRFRREEEAALMSTEAEAGREPWEAVAPVLDEAMQGLGQADREAILLHFFEGKPFAEVGRKLQLKEDAVRMRVNRALEKLRIALEQRGVASSGAGLILLLNREAATALPAHLLAGAGRIAAAAGSAAQALPAATLLQLMSTSKLALGVLAIAGILALATGWHEVEKIQQERAALVGWDRRIAAVRQRAAASGQLAPGATSGPRTAVVRPRGAAGAAGDAMPSDDEIARQLQLLRLKSQQSIADQLLKHGDAVRALGITNDQIAALRTEANQAMSDMSEVQLEAELAGVPISSDPELLQKAQQIVADYQAAATTILGSEKLQALQNFQLSLSNQAAPDPSQPTSRQLGVAQYEANEVAGLVFAGSTPVSPQQRAQLTQIFVQNEPRYGPSDNADMDTINWSGAVTQARAAGLPAEQVQAIQSLKSTNDYNRIEGQLRAALSRSP